MYVGEKPVKLSPTCSSQSAVMLVKVLQVFRQHTFLLTNIRTATWYDISVWYIFEPYKSIPAFVWLFTGEIFCILLFRKCLLIQNTSVYNNKTLKMHWQKMMRCLSEWLDRTIKTNIHFLRLLAILISRLVKQVSK